MSERPEPLFDRTIEATALALADVRETLHEYLGVPTILDGETRHAALVVTSELVTNAIVHGCGAPISIGARRLDVGVEITCGQRCDGRGISPVAEWLMPTNPLQVSGRGLAIVAALSDVVIVSTDATSTLIRCRIGTSP